VAGGDKAQCKTKWREKSLLTQKTPGEGVRKGGGKVVGAIKKKGKEKEGKSGVGT